MKNLFLLLAILFIMAGCHREKTQEEKKDSEMTAMIHKMKYNEYRDIENLQFGYLIDRIRASERMGKVVQLGEEEFDVFHYNDSTDAYPYCLEGKRYTLCINPKSIFPDHFTIMKTWNENQDQYNEGYLWSVFAPFFVNRNTLANLLRKYILSTG